MPTVRRPDLPLGLVFAKDLEISAALQVVREMGIFGGGGLASSVTCGGGDHDPSGLNTSWDSKHINTGRSLSSPSIFFHCHGSDFGGPTRFPSCRFVGRSRLVSVS
jgi:hypothetical protein